MSDKATMGHKLKQPTADDLMSPLAYLPKTVRVTRQKGAEPHRTQNTQVHSKVNVYASSVVMRICTPPLGSLHDESKTS